MPILPIEAAVGGADGQVGTTPDDSGQLDAADDAVKWWLLGLTSACPVALVGTLLAVVIGVLLYALQPLCLLSEVRTFF